MISCHDYDDVEISCTYQYPVSLILKSGKHIDCIAKDTGLNGDRQECIKVEINATERLVLLDEVIMMKARANNPHFDSVSFR